MTGVLPPGLYATFAGRECQVIRSGGWKILTRDPDSVRDGFRSIGHDRYVRPVGRQDVLSVRRLSYAGTYRRIPVDAEPGTGGGVMLSTSDARAQAAGFASLDRGTWELVVDEDDVQLRISPRWENVREPWLDEESKREGDR